MQKLSVCADSSNNNTEIKAPKPLGGKQFRLGCCQKEVFLEFKLNAIKNFFISFGYSLLGVGAATKNASRRNSVEENFVNHRFVVENES